MENQNALLKKRNLSSEIMVDTNPSFSKNLKLDKGSTDKKEVFFGKLPFSRYVQNPPIFTRPIEIGTFGYDKERRFVLGNQELKYYYPADLKHPCLSKGYDKYICRDTSKNENLDGLLKFLISSNHPQLHKNRPKLFVLYRGVMTRIFCLLYNKKENFSISATLFKGVIYINEIKEENKLNEQALQTDKQKLMCYWGYKFETLSTLPQPPSLDLSKIEKLLEERLEEPVNNHNEHCSVFTASLGDISLLMGAEVDCVEEHKSTNKNHPEYVELKTSRVIENNRQESNFERFKLLKFWAQSFLAGIPKVVVGFRNDDGVLKSIQSFNTLEIPKLVQKNKSWEPSVCLDFAKKFLDFLSENIHTDDPLSTYTVSYDSVSQQIKLYFNPAPSPNAFLTSDFIDSVESVFDAN